MEIAYNSPLPPSRQLAPRPETSTAVVRRSEGALSKKAKRVPVDQGLEGELLKGRAHAPSSGDGLRGYAYRGENRAEGLTPARRAASVYLHHARLTSQSPVHTVDVYA